MIASWHLTSPHWSGGICNKLSDQTVYNSPAKTPWQLLPGLAGVMSSPVHLCNSIIDLWQTSPDSKEEKCPVKLAGSAEHITIKSRLNRETLSETQTLLWNIHLGLQTFRAFSGYQLVTFTLQHLFWKCCFLTNFYILWREQIITLTQIYICVNLDALRAHNMRYFLCIQ